ITTSLICLVLLLATERQARSRASDRLLGSPRQDLGRPNIVSVPLFVRKIAQHTPRVKRASGMARLPGKVEGFVGVSG
ncbi:MAG TPA: hypothetical protein PLW35_07075, partial [Verrucomicrobiota bacterium]|nr:hypothetical protein [Verrucomicrobiota bacterium]